MAVVILLELQSYLTNTHSHKYHTIIAVAKTTHIYGHCDFT